jgi:hypothetical protein
MCDEIGVVVVVVKPLHIRLQENDVNIMIKNIFWMVIVDVWRKSRHRLLPLCDDSCNVQERDITMN